MPRTYDPKPRAKAPLKEEPESEEEQSLDEVLQEIDEEPVPATPSPPPPTQTVPGDPLYRGDGVDHARVGAAYRFPIVGSGNGADLHRESVHTPEGRHRDYNFNTGIVIVYYPVGVPASVSEAAKDPTSKVVKLRD